MSGFRCAFHNQPCPQDRMQESRYCIEHKCKFEGCKNPRTWVEDVCRTHTCRFRSRYVSHECHFGIDPSDGIHCTKHKHGGVWNQAGECRCKACLVPTKSAYKV
jgi:hypothetical protein